MRPFIDYAWVNWGATSQCNFKRVIRLRKDAVRVSQWLELGLRKLKMFRPLNSLADRSRSL